MEEPLLVVQLRSSVFLRVFQDSEKSIRAMLNAPGYSAALRYRGPEHIPIQALGSAKVSFSAELRTFSLRFPLRGGGCQLSTPSRNTEPEAPATSPEQQQVSLVLRSLHQFHLSYDFRKVAELRQDLRSLLTARLLRPYAVLKTVMEVNASLKWQDRVVSSWVLTMIRELLGIVHLNLLLDCHSVSKTTQHYLRQLVPALPPEESETDRLHLFLDCQLSIIQSGLEVLTANTFPADQDFRTQLLKTIGLLRGGRERISEAVQFGAEFYRLSLFHRAISVDVAGEVARTNPEGAEFLLTFLRADSSACWQLRYLAMMKLAEVLDCLDPTLQKKVLEGHLPKTHGLLQVLATAEGDQPWVLRAAAYHAFTVVAMVSSNEDIRDLATSALESARTSEVDISMRQFMRHTKALRRLVDPTLEEFANSDQQLLMTIPSGVGRAYLGNCVTFEVSLFEKDFLHGSSRIVVLKLTAIITGGVSNPRSCYEVSLVTGEFVKLASLAAGRFWHSAIVLGGEVFVSGGRNKKEVIASMECLKAGTWCQSESLNIARESHSAAATQGAMYVFGGAGNEGALLSIEKSTPEGWIVLPVQLPEARTSAGVFFLTPSRALIAGGKLQKDRKEVWQLDLSSGEVVDMPKLPMSCCFASNAVAGKDGFVYLLSSTELELLQLDMIEPGWKVSAAPLDT